MLLNLDREDASQFIKLRLSDPKIKNDFIKARFSKALIGLYQNSLNGLKEKRAREKASAPTDFITITSKF